MAIPTFLLVLSDPDALLASLPGLLNCIFKNYKDEAWDLWLIYLPESSRKPLTRLEPHATSVFALFCVGKLLCCISVTV